MTVDAILAYVGIILSTVFANVVSWVNKIFSATGMAGWYLAAISIVLMVRLFVSPFVGASISSGASDMVKKPKEKRSQKNKGG